MRMTTRMKMSATTTRKEVALRATEYSQLRRAGGGDGGLIDRSPGRGISRAPPSSGGASSSSVTTSVKRWSCWAVGEVSASGAGPAQAPAGSSRARSGWRRSGGAVLGWEADLRLRRRSLTRPALASAVGEKGDQEEPHEDHDDDDGHEPQHSADAEDGVDLACIDGLADRPRRTRDQRRASAGLQLLGGRGLSLLLLLSRWRGRSLGLLADRRRGRSLGLLAGRRWRVRRGPFRAAGVVCAAGLIAHLSPPTRWPGQSCSEPNRTCRS